MQKEIITTLAILLFIFSGCSNNSSDQESRIIDIDKTSSLRSTGDSANEILSNANFDKLLIEIAYVDGFRPTQVAIDNFVNFIKKHTFKDDIDVVYKLLQSPKKEKLNLQEIADFEAENRTVYNTGKSLSLFVYFADAPSDEDREEEDLVTLGAVYRNTSMVVFESTVRRLAGQSLTISYSDVETVTLNHELGHLFGLVNLGSPTINEHEDLNAEHHCTVNGCLMLADIQLDGSHNKTPSLSRKHDTKSQIVPACQLRGESVLKILERSFAKGKSDELEFDSECLMDLKANGGK